MILKYFGLLKEDMIYIACVGINLICILCHDIVDKDNAFSRPGV